MGAIQGPECHHRRLTVTVCIHQAAGCSSVQFFNPARIGQRRDPAQQQRHPNAECFHRRCTSTPLVSVCHTTTRVSPLWANRGWSTRPRVLLNRRGGANVSPLSKENWVYKWVCSPSNSFQTNVMLWPRAARSAWAAREPPTVRCPLGASAPNRP